MWECDDMRECILEILRSKMPAPVSGEVLSQELAVSRTAIWKHIQALKNEGYTIESVPKKGYILKEVPGVPIAIRSLSAK